MPDLLPISALQHLAYCPRQFGLIHIEQSWAENLFTAEGRVLHERVDTGRSDSRGDVHIARSLRLVSQALGLSGIADVVEFYRLKDPTTEDPNEKGVTLPGRRGRWQPFPVEYKRGRSKREDWDRIQLCAQALCLEEMLDTSIPEGALFYGKARRREPVSIDGGLRTETRALAERMHTMWAGNRTPSPEPGPKCKNCSLNEICLPKHGNVGAYLREMLDG
ncbi:MAG: CRISPR-associated protein Cas4 [Gammaproteobacteria bacterium]|nr:CRISPR-associated protein Cas4 [Gammaproteobacteria bacterium]NNJ84609.1 CRISPR-associated protein Cas4 [Gammaproteobacteria bacterium]